MLNVSTYITYVPLTIDTIVFFGNWGNGLRKVALALEKATATARVVFTGVCISKLGLIGT